MATQQFIQVRGSGDVFYYTEALASRDDVDIIEAPNGFTPDQVKEQLVKAQEALSAQAEAAVREAEAALAQAGAAGVKVAPRTRKLTKVEAPAGVTVQRAAPKPDGDGGTGDGNTGVDDEDSGGPGQ